MRALLPDGLSMDVLRSGSQLVGDAARTARRAATAEDAIWALAATPALVADIARMRAGEALVDARPELSLVENFMLKMSGRARRTRRRPVRSTRTSPSPPSTA